ncbi:MAG TPA: hypothetical protein VFY90_10845 [Tepidiformaceae bacterium]|nr:hypothetical protein [Tepidiformaceae bacterium]
MWKFSSLVTEAAINTRTSSGRTAILIATATVALGVLSFLELRDASDALEFSELYQARGGYILVASSEAGISARSCVSLKNRITGVRAAGGYRQEGTLLLAAEPDSVIPHMAATLDMLQLWSNYTVQLPTGDGLTLGGSVAERFGLVDGSTAKEVELDTHSVSVLPRTGRTAEADGWAATVIPPIGDVTECWVEFSPGSFEAGRDAVAPYLSRGTSPVRLLDFLQVDPALARNSAAELARRPQRAGWSAASVLLAFVWWLSVWFRRAEYGLYLTLRMTRAYLFVMLAVEFGLICATGGVLALLWSFAVAHLFDLTVTMGSLRLAILTVTSTQLLAFLLAPWAAAGLRTNQISTLLREQ